MPHNPDSPAAWLAYAVGDLALAEGTGDPRVPLAYLCFHAQQAAEKSIKAVLVARGIHFPRTHNIEFLIGLLPADVQRAPDLMAAIDLEGYATDQRYPSAGEDITDTDHREALRLATAVVRWATEIVGA